MRKRVRLMNKVITAIALFGVAVGALAMLLLLVVVIVVLLHYGGAILP